MLFWIAAAGLTAITVILIVRPLLRGGGAQPGGDALAIYRDQLDEIERDRTRGVLAGSEAEAARTEISRRLLAAARRHDVGQTPRPLRILAFGLIGLVPVLAVGLYLFLGTPGLPSQPLFARDTAALQAFSAAVAEAEDLARQLEATPDELDGWVTLGDRYAAIGLWMEARDAYGRAAGLGRNDPGLASAYAETLVRVNEGTVSAEARDAFHAVLTMDPGDPRARFYLGLAAAQAGDYAAALDRWRDLAAETPPGAPWRETLAAEMRRAAEASGADPEAALAAFPRPSGPTQADIDAAAAMTPEQQRAMIEGMVEGLAGRLEVEPDDAGGWLRLAGAYRVLERPDEARGAYRAALDAADGSVDVLRVAVQGIIDLSPPGELLDDLRAPLQDLLAAAPEDETALFFLGLLAARDGDVETALVHWRMLADLLPEGGEARRALIGQIETMTGDAAPPAAADTPDGDAE